MSYIKVCACLSYIIAYSNVRNTSLFKKNFFLKISITYLRGQTGGTPKLKRIAELRKKAKIIKGSVLLSHVVPGMQLIPL